MADRVKDRVSGTSVSDHYDVSDQELESTLERYLEEDTAKYTPKPLNFITISGLAILAVSMLMILRLIIPFQFDFAPVLNMIIIFGGALTAFVGLGVFGRDRKKRKQKKATLRYREINKAAAGSGSLDAYALTRRKKLYKSATNRRIFGVCGGLAEYFGVDVTLIRILFTAFVFLGYGSSLFIYLFLALVLPVKPKEVTQESDN